MLCDLVLNYGLELQENSIEQLQSVFKHIQQLDKNSYTESVILDDKNSLQLNYKGNIYLFNKKVCNT